MRCAKRLFFFAAISFLSAIKLSANEPKIRVEELPFFHGTVLDIRVNERAAEVYINNEYKGNTPFVSQQIAGGDYTLRIEKKGFYAQEFECMLENGNKYTVWIELKEITGTLHIKADEPEAQLYVDGNSWLHFSDSFSGIKPEQNKANGQNTKGNSEWNLEVSEGYHTVEVKKFGKQSALSRVYVFRATRVKLDFHLQQADCGITSFSSSVQRFNPHNPGALGICRFNFSVTAAGNGALEIYDSSANRVYRLDLPPFTREDQSCVWDGRDENGKILESGLYTAYLKINGGKATTNFAPKALPIIIDNSLFYSLVAPVATPFSLVPSVRLMPKGSIRSTFTVGTDFLLKKGFNSAPLFLSFAYTPLNFLEGSCSIGTEIGSKAQNPFIIQAGVKVAGSTKPFYYGALLRYAYSSKTALHILNETGVSTASVFGAELSCVCITVSEEAVFANGHTLLVPFEGKLKTGVSCTVQHSFYALHLSAAFSSPFTKNGIQAFAGIHGGAQFSCLPAKTAFMPFAGLYYTYNADGTRGISLRTGAAIFP